MRDFQRPDLNTPLDVEGYASQVSKTAMVRGLFHQMLIDEVKAQTGRSIGRASYIGLKYYPLAELTQLDIEAARILYPDLPQQDGIRRLGRRAYQTFINGSTFAKVTFSLINNPSTLMSSIGRMGSFVLNEGSITATNTSEHQAVLQFRGIWLLECVTLGSIEGLFEHLGRKHEILTRAHSRCDFDFKVSWE